MSPERRPLEGARMRHQRPFRRPLRPERAALALWVTPVHASSMVESTADDHLTVDGDAMFVVGADPEHAACTSPRAEGCRPLDCSWPHSVDATECGREQSAGLRRSGRYRQHARGQRRRQTLRHRRR